MTYPIFRAVISCISASVERDDFDRRLFFLLIISFIREGELEFERTNCANELLDAREKILFFLETFLRLPILLRLELEVDNGALS